MQFPINQDSQPPVAASTVEMLEADSTVNNVSTISETETGLVQRRKYGPARSVEEKIIAQIWESLLEVENIGVHDNFLLLGGESLLATQVVTRIREAFDVEISIRSVFLGTIAEIAAEVVAKKTLNNP